MRSRRRLILLAIWSAGCGGGSAEPAPELTVDAAAPQEGGGTQDATVDGSSPPRREGSGDDGPATSPCGPASHGAQLTRESVGPECLGVSTGQLRKTAVGGERISTWPTDGRPSWIPGTPYVYDDDPANHGGVVPEGGMTIDGFEVPGGAWVAQFDDFGDEGILVPGDNGGTTPALPGVVFRGCRFRGAVTAPGFLNLYAGSHVRLFVLYSDAGGLGADDAQYNEVAFATNDDTASAVFYRNYVSYTTTGIQPGVKRSEVVENLIEKITFFYGEAGPPAEGGPKHLNGISLNGGQESALILRNKVLLQNPDDAGRTVAQTDAIALFQDGGEFPGTGTSSDGSLGYQIRDNYVGGGGYCFYAGMNEGKPSGSVQSLVLCGNQVTTAWWPKGGSFGPLAAEPAWGSYGNVKDGNTFAETGTAW